jgi:hypothetical protein
MSLTRPRAGVTIAPSFNPPLEAAMEKTLDLALAWVRTGRRG